MYRRYDITKMKSLSTNLVFKENFRKFWRNFVQMKEKWYVATNIYRNELSYASHNFFFFTNI